jgi:hypothetical protein
VTDARELTVNYFLQSFCVREQLFAVILRLWQRQTVKFMRRRRRRDGQTPRVGILLVSRARAISREMFCRAVRAQFRALHAGGFVGVGGRGAIRLRLWWRTWLLLSTWLVRRRYASAAAFWPLPSPRTMRKFHATQCSGLGRCFQCDWAWRKICGLSGFL